MSGIIKKIDQIIFGLMSPEQIRAMSVVKIDPLISRYYDYLTGEEITNYGLTYDEDGFPFKNGLMDPRLGVINSNSRCQTCGNSMMNCPGHFGHIELAKPVIHVGFGNDIYQILRSTCSQCGRVLLDEFEIEEYTERIDELHSSGESLEETIKEVYRICKERKITDFCPHCGGEQYDVRFIEPCDFIELRFIYDENGEIITDIFGNPLTEDYDLTPSEVREKLQCIPDDDAYVLGVNPHVARPEWMVLTVLPVPPVNLRPSLMLDSGEMSEDDLTHKLSDILRINQMLEESLDAGAPELIVDDYWKLLQYHVATYFDNEALGVPPARHRNGRQLKTLMQRLKGKNGRFRANLLGKPVNYLARTIITPDPNISINEVGVPEMIAKEVTIPAYVNEWNIDELKEAIYNGIVNHPGANFIEKPKYNKKFINVLFHDYLAENLEYGDIVHRHLRDGDIVLLNHQPSIHRMSIMAHEVRILPYKTFRLNPCLCPPYNADFDGDVVNMHVLQNDLARAEAKTLMRVQENIISPRFGGPIIGAINDHLSGAYLLTRDGFTIPEDDAFQMIRESHLLNNSYVNKFHLMRKNRNWTGKELFSLLLPDDLNMIYKANICHVCDICKQEDCIYDAFVIIKDGQLLCGAIDGGAYGSLSGKILDKIVKEYGPSRAKEFIDRSTDLAISAINRIGISISLNDFEIPEEAYEIIDTYLDMAEQRVDELIDIYEQGLLIPLPGRSVEETFEMRIMGVLEEARDSVGKIAESYFYIGKQLNDDSYDHIMAVENKSLLMVRTGAKASEWNLDEIVASIGQQTVRGRRITRGYQGRPLPHIKKHELGAKEKGFVRSSFKKGLDPVEFFFHAMNGRESLVDTAIRTAQSGYMLRRLSNALVDLNTTSDGLVFDNNGKIIQRMFGEDGIDPVKSDFGHIANLDSLIDEIRINSHNSHSYNYENNFNRFGRSNDSEKTNSSNKKREVNSLNIDWNNILKNIDLGLYSDEIIVYCKEKVENEFKQGKIDKDQFKSQFKFYLKQKIRSN